MDARERWQAWRAKYGAYEPLAFLCAAALMVWLFIWLANQWDLW